MQKAVAAEKSQKPEKAEKTLASSISAAKMSVLSVPIKNAPGSPLVINAFSAKAREAMRAAQEAGSAGKNKRQRAPKDFDAVYQNARHISREGWDGAAAATFRNAMIDSCRLVGFKMTVGKLTIFIEPDGVSRSDGTPLVRIYGEPVAFESIGRNQNGGTDIRVRPRWDEWSANLRIRFDSEQFSEMDVINLLVRAGGQCGICEGRPNSSTSFGLGWGLFEIDNTKEIWISEIPAPKIEFRRK